MLLPQQLLFSPLLFVSVFPTTYIYRPAHSPPKQAIHLTSSFVYPLRQSTPPFRSPPPHPLPPPLASSSPPLVLSPPIPALPLAKPPHGRSSPRQPDTRTRALPRDRPSAIHNTHSYHPAPLASPSDARVVKVHGAQAIDTDKKWPRIRMRMRMRRENGDGDGHRHADEAMDGDGSTGGEDG